ncbi:MAG: Xaa-Pro peptidase family protein [Candidatus Thermoplasmatota archaeon]
MVGRIQRIINNSPPNIQAILIKNGNNTNTDENFFYITGLHQGLFEGSYVILHSDRTIDLITSELEAESAKKTKAHIHIAKKKDDTEQLLKQICSQDKIIGLNYQKISYADFCILQRLFPETQFPDISEPLKKTRLIKDYDEIETIHHACKIADAVMEQIPSFIHPGISETELAAEIDYHLQKAGAEKPAFTTISSFGQNTAEPHYSHGEKRVQQGDFIICDFGARYHQYNSDITRTFVFGKATEYQKKMYNTVFSAHQLALEIIKPGVPAHTIHTNVLSHINQTEFNDRFIHATGHSLGLAVHDGPGFTQENTELLQENMILTIEPGIYLPNTGGVRLEDDILITQKGSELLTKTPRKLIEI